MPVPIFTLSPYNTISTSLFVNHTTFTVKPNILQGAHLQFKSKQ